MHFDFLPKVIHNEDAIREYEREESGRVKRWVKRFVLAAIPVLVLVAWLILR
jgi:hypothetical protein